MTEEEARAAAKTLRRTMIGVVADQTDGDWGVRPWAKVGSAEVHTDFTTMPAEWLQELGQVPS